MRVGFLFFWGPNLVIYLRPRVVLPSAESSITFGREQHYLRPKADHFIGGFGKLAKGMKP